MKAQRDWEPLVRRMEQLLRLKSFPVAFKMLEKRSELDRIPFLRRTTGKSTLCQLISRVRNFDWTVGADAEDFTFPTCPSIIGLTDTPVVHKDGTFRSIVWVKNKEDGKRYESAIPRIPLGRYEAVAMAPLVYNPFEPDIVLIYANPAQMILMINALQFEDYEVMRFSCVGESSCADAVARCYNDGKPSLSIPCYGERRYGHAQDDELAMALPAQCMEKALRGLEALYRRGVRYPISYAGSECDVSPLFPPAYHRVGDLMERLRGHDNRILVGLTGGIATGKSTVAGIFGDLGAPLIDFDQIARRVVAPGTPGFEKIVDYFGRQVLDENGTLDRKKLSRIVFGDMEKRKRLEGFTHPYIYEAFLKDVEQIAAQKTDAIIVVEVPLLIELNLQYLFDKSVVVYTPEKDQIARLTKRDGISVEQAVNILKSQLSIEEKRLYADYVIENIGDLDDTRRQAADVWTALESMQRQRKRGGMDG